MFLVYKKFSKKIFAKFPPKESYDKDYFHPSKDAALLYGPLGCFHSPIVSYLRNTLKYYERKDSFLHRSKEKFFCLKLLLPVEMNET